MHAPIPVEPGKPKRIDDEYVRHGVAEIFLEVEPLTGRRHVAITEHRTRQDWARWIKDMLDERYPDAAQVCLVMDNLNTHSAASLYEAFPPAEARRLFERLDIHYAQARQLAQHGGDRIERLERAVSGPAYPGSANDAQSCRRVGERPEQSAIQDQLAVYKRGSAD